MVPGLSAPSVEDRINFIRQRRHHIVQNSINEHQQDVITATQEIAVALLNRQADIEQAIKELMEEAAAIDFLSASRSQCDNLEQTLQGLKHVNTNLNEKLVEGEKGLEDLQRRKIQLQATLRTFKQTLESGKNKSTPLQGFLYQGGENLSRYISQNRNT
jgi:chromosome segregation ATPase